MGIPPQLIQTTRPAVAALGTVMVVDDTEAMRRLYAHVLTASGYHVLQAESAAVARCMIARERPDLLLLDYMMPQETGPQLLRSLRDDPATCDIPAILLTTVNHTEGIEEAFAAGADDYLTKPVDRRILLSRVGASLDARRARSQREALERERNALRDEIGEARRVQQAQLPPMPWAHGPWAMSAALVPCGAVGGDLFDIVPGFDGAHVAVLLDVSGHGLAAAMIASSIRSVLRLLLREMPMPLACAQLNRMLLGGHDDRYACIALVELRGDEVTIVNAGLPPVLVVAADGAVRSVARCGTPPGLVQGAAYDAVTETTEPGARIVLVSDGLTEPFGSATASLACAERLGVLPARAAASVLAAANPFAPLDARIAASLAEADGRQADDATIVVLDRAF